MPAEKRPFEINGHRYATFTEALEAIRAIWSAYKAELAAPPDLAGALRGDSDGA